MSLFGAKKTSTFQRAKERMDKLMSETASPAGTDESSHIGELLERQQGPLPTDPDGTATTSEIAREELGDYLGEVQPAVVTLTREQFNHGIRIHNAEVRADGHPSQVIEPIWGTAEVIDEYGNRRSHAVHTISSDDSSLSPPPTTDYGGSEISFPLQTPKEKALSPPPTRIMREAFWAYLRVLFPRILFRLPGQALELSRVGIFSWRKIPANTPKRRGEWKRPGKSTHPFRGNSKAEIAVTTRTTR